MYFRNLIQGTSRLFQIWQGLRYSAVHGRCEIPEDPVRTEQSRLEGTFIDLLYSFYLTFPPFNLLRSEFGTHSQQNGSKLRLRKVNRHLCALVSAQSQLLKSNQRNLIFILFSSYFQRNLIVSFQIEMRSRTSGQS